MAKHAEQALAAIVSIFDKLTSAMQTSWLICSHAERFAQPGQDHGHHHRDNNLRAAYVHVLADAATSILAIWRLPSR